MCPSKLPASRGARLTVKTQSKGRLELFLEKTDKKTVMGLLLIIVIVIVIVIETWDNLICYIVSVLKRTKNVAKWTKNEAKWTLFSV